MNEMAPQYPDYPAYQLLSVHLAWILLKMWWSMPVSLTWLSSQLKRCLFWWS